MISECPDFIQVVGNVGHRAKSNGEEIMKQMSQNRKTNIFGENEDVAEQNSQSKSREKVENISVKNAENGGNDNHGNVNIFENISGDCLEKSTEKNLFANGRNNRHAKYVQ